MQCLFSLGGFTKSFIEFYLLSSTEARVVVKVGESTQNVMKIWKVLLLVFPFNYLD